MTNSQIKKYFKLSFYILSSICSAVLFFTFLKSFEIGKFPNEGFVLFILYVAFSPFLFVAIVRIYNLLIHGKFIIEEMK